MLQRITAGTLALLLMLALGGCLKTYKIDVQQGNIINPSAASKIHNGMKADEVIQALGQPIFNNIYNDNLVYVYYFKPGYGPVTQKKLVITLRNNRVVNVEKGQ